MTLDLQQVDALIARASSLVDSLTSLRPTLESPVTPAERLASSLQDLTSVARSTLSLCASLLSDTESHKDGQISPRPVQFSAADEIVSRGSLPTPVSRIASSTGSPVIVENIRWQTKESAPLQDAGVAADARKQRKRLPSSATSQEIDTPNEPEPKRPRLKNAISPEKARTIEKTPRQLPTDLDKLIYKIKNRDKLSRVPSFSVCDPPTLLMLRRAAAVQGGPAIRQLCSLIRARRSRETEMGLLQVNDSAGIERALELTKRLRLLIGRTAVGSFLTRLLQFHIATAVDSTKDGRIRADGAQITKMMNKLGWADVDRQRFFYYLKQGRLWRAVCGQQQQQQHAGLLSLIPLKSEQPYGVSANDFLHMKGDELNAFTKMIHTPYLVRLSEAAAAFQDMVMGVREDTEFVWEKIQPELYGWEGSLPEEDLLSLVQPHPSCEDCLYDEADFAGSARPPNWPEDWDWPAHPLLIPPGLAQCDFCDQNEDGSSSVPCSCRQTRVVTPSRRPRIKAYGKQGIGLQAIAHVEGGVAYQKGEAIGQLTGRLVPAHTHPYDSLWIVEMQRFDLGDFGDLGDRNICQIDVGGPASTFRNLNHSCRASARFIPRRASGRWIMAVEATRDIRHGEQITINFGKSFLRNQGLRCECEACHVSSR